MKRGRLMAGWGGALLASAVLASGTLLVVRNAVGGEAVGPVLSAADVGAALASNTPLQTPPPATASARPSAVPTHHASPKPTHSAPTVTTSPTVAPSTHASASQSPSPTHAASPTPVALSSAGGTVVATCSRGPDHWLVYLVSWSPAQGYTVSRPDSRGPSEEVELEFQSSSRTVDVKISCRPSGPVQQVSTSTDGGKQADH